METLSTSSKMVAVLNRNSVTVFTESKKEFDRNIDPTFEPRKSCFCYEMKLKGRVTG
jgi:hypothetical protein